MLRVKNFINLKDAYIRLKMCLKKIEALKLASQYQIEV